MIQQKKTFLNYLRSIEKELDGSSISVEDTKVLENEIENCELVVPVVGGFSAGKSSLINSFLEINVLPTNLTPETALATELRYSQNDYIEAIKEDGSVDKFEIQQHEEIKNNAKKYKYLKLYLNNDKLKSIEPFVLVDMPGFDSPLELHNQAILNYLNKGVYFIILLSVEDGTIPKSILNELENISDFGKDFSFCLSKTNLKSPQDVESIRQQVSEQLEDFDFEKEIVLLDDNGGENLEKIFQDMDSEKLFYSLFIDDLKRDYFRIDSAISTTISVLKSDKDDSLQAIQALNDSIKNIENKKIKMINEAQRRYSNNTTESIVSIVGEELSRNQEQLVSLVSRDKESFQREVNSIVKNKLISELNSRMKTIGENIVDDFSIELKNLGNESEGFTIDRDWIEKISGNTKQILQSTQHGLEKITDATKGKSGAIYKVIATTLGITTTILNPILEVIIIFLPDIINFITGKSQEAKRQEMLRQKFTNEIIPGLKNQLRSKVDEIMQQQVQQLIESIGEQFEKQLEQKKQEVEVALKEKEANIQQIEAQIETLLTLEKSIKSIATSVIF
ncbi:dynamin family protein [Sulfurimonas sp. NW15]|uniref:dynamin family protein n=1 Tax=Sulfurimonas sp. NW15 TaxID=2922729 RepID=UPI003DAA2509